MGGQWSLKNFSMESTKVTKVTVCWLIPVPRARARNAHKQTKCHFSHFAPSGDPHLRDRRPRAVRPLAAAAGRAPRRATPRRAAVAAEAENAVPPRRGVIASLTRRWRATPRWPDLSVGPVNAPFSCGHPMWHSEIHTRRAAYFLRCTKAAIRCVRVSSLSLGRGLGLERAVSPVARTTPRSWRKHSARLI
jgi:hypothetical protein